MARLVSVILCMVLGVSIMATPIMAESFIVGDSNGWALGVDYTTWVSTKAFTVGDSLVFNYGISHSVVEVGSSEYASCSLSNPLSADRSGATTITLKTPGEHYFVCGVLGHCDGGQKLAITVSADDTAAAPLGSTTDAPPSGNIAAAPETPSTTSGAPTSTKNNDVPPHSSSATSLSPMTTIFFMACGILASKLIFL